jgi:tetratricopeptide (TPR) repeat protein
MKTRKRIASAMIITALIGFVISGCSQEAKTGRHLEKANQYFQLGNYDAAEIEYKNTLQLDKQNAMAMKRLGIIYAEQGRLVRANYILSTARQLNTNDLEIRFRQSRLWAVDGQNREAREEALFVLGKTMEYPEAAQVLALSANSTNLMQEARQRVQQLQQQHGDNAQFQIALGILHLRQRDFKSAETAYQKALTLNPKSDDAHFGLSSVYLHLTNFPAAEQHLKQAAELAPVRSGKSLRYALFKLERGAPEEARKMIEDILRQAPDYMPALRVLAGITFNDHNMEVSARAVKELLEREPLDYEAMLLKSRIEMAQSNPAAATLTLTRLCSMYTNSAQIQFHLGVALLANNEPLKAVERLQQAIRLDTNLVDAVLLLAEQDIRRGETASAISTLEPLTRRQPPIVVAFQLLAEAHLAARAPDEALATYRRLMALFPKSPEPMIQMGAILLKNNRATEARQMLEQAVQLAPLNLAATELLVSQDLQEKNYDRALQRVQPILATNSTAVGAMILQGRILQAQGSYPQAEAVMTKVLELAPDARTAYLSLAEIYVATHREQEALTKLQAEVARQTNDWRAWTLIGTIQDRLKKYAEAAASFDKVLAVTPTNTIVLNNLAYLYSERLNQPEKALPLAQKAQLLDPDNPAVTDTLGWILCQRGDYARAVTFLQQSSRKLGDMPEVQYHLAMAHYMLGDEPPARAALERALQSNQDFPGRPDATRRLAFLKLDPGTMELKSIRDMEKYTSDLPGDPSGDPIALARTASLTEKSGAFDQACEAYEKALKLNPKSLSMRLKLAQLYAERLQDPKRALEQAKEARALAPDDPAIAHFLGRLAFLAGDHQWAANLLLQSAQQLPQQSEVIYHLARAQFSLGQVEDAALNLRRALSAGASFADAPAAQRMLELVTLYTNSAPIAPSAGRIQETIKSAPHEAAVMAVTARLADESSNPAAAKQAYERLLERYPSFTPGIRRLALLYSESSTDAKAAYDWAAKARKAFPNDPQIAKVLGMGEFKRGEYSRAAQLLKESAKTRGNDGEVFFYLGMAHYQLKESKDAADGLRRALALNLKQEQAEEAKRTLASIK